MSVETTKANHAAESDYYSRDLSIGIAIAVATLVGGGAACGWLVNRFGEFGAFSFLLLGWIAGLAARTFMKRPRKSVGYAVAAAVVIAMLIAEVTWIRWNIQDVDGWGKAISLLPDFCQRFTMSAFLAGLCAFFGASSAYREAGVRYKLVRVVEE